MAATAVRSAGQDLFDAPSSGPIVLPPFIVTDTGLPWTHARVGNLEILSRCSDSKTRRLIVAMSRAQQTLETLLPPELQARYSAPLLCIFYDRDMSAAMPEAIRRSMSNAVAGGLTTVPNFILADRDQAEVVVLYDSDNNRLLVGPGYLQFLMGNRSPLLPRWFRGGIWQMYGMAERSGDTVTLSSVLLPSGRQKWIPLGQLFSETPFAGHQKDPDFIRLWQQQVRQLMRWAFDDAHPDRRRNLWRFAALESVAGEPSPELFEKCFGFGYAEMLQDLQDTFSGARLFGNIVNKPWVLKITSPEVDPGSVEIRVATDAEIGRIKGNWERLATRYVKDNLPDLVPAYEARAMQTLSHAMEHSPADPGLNMTLGLLESENGHSDAARGHLDAAVRGKVDRPSPYFVLADIRYRAVGAAASGEGNALTLPQAMDVTSPLIEAFRLDPPIADAFRLLDNVWARCPESLPAEVLSIVRKGPELYPFDWNLIFDTAVVEVRHGLTADAAALADRAIRVAPTAAQRDRFQKLKTAPARPSPADAEHP